MLVSMLLVSALLVPLQEPAPAATPAPTPVPEVRVRAVVEELRGGELVLDADTIEPLLAHSFSLIEGGDRIAGAYAYLETIRRMRERGAEVRQLSFDDVRVEAFGASAVVTYMIKKVWKDGGLHRQEGWCSDIFERRDDGAWILVHRHRP